MKRKDRFTVTPEIQQTTWDAIVIGSGLTGLATAVTLAHKGKKVLVLEQHYVPGGYVSSFKRKGFTFEVSLHQTIALGEGGYLNKILTQLNVMEKITPIPLDSTLKLKTNLGDLFVGPEYLNQLKQIFPLEAENIEKLDNLIDTLRREAQRAMMLSTLPNRIRRVLARLITPTVFRYHRQTLTDILDAHFRDDRLKQLIAVQWGYYGLPQDRISGLMYLLAFGGFLKDGIYYLKGTSQSLSNALVERLEELGGALLLRHNAEEIIVENGRVVGVRSRAVKKKGEGDAYEFRASVIISNANPFVTFNRLLDGEKYIPPAYRDIMQRLEPSTSAVVAYIGLDCPFETLSHDRHHSISEIDLDDYDVNKTYREAVAGKNTGFGGLIHYSIMDPDLAPPGKSVIATIRNEFDTAWKGLSEEAYRAKKAAVTEEIIAALDERYPGIRHHIEVIEVGTPRTMTRYTNNPNGAFNGYAYTVERVGMFDGGLPAKTPIKGLYLASAWVGAVGGGHAGSIPSGFMLGQMIARSKN
jgi:prolycopene isomerase